MRQPLTISTRIVEQARHRREQRDLERRFPFAAPGRSGARTGTITHLWTDPGFDFNPGQEFYPESRVLERHGKARPFQWKGEWRDEVDGLLQIENAFKPDASLRWLSFETRSGP